MILATGMGGKNRFSQPNIFLNRPFSVLDLTPIATIDRRVGWTYPPPFPGGKGANRLIIL
jgi:hypothetical protein